TRRARHTERLHYAFLNEFRPAFARNACDDLARDYVEIIVVIVLRPELRNLLQISEIVDDVLYRKIAAIGEEHQIARTEPEPASMRQQVLDRKILRHIWRVQFELRYVILNAVVPLDLAFIDKHSESEAGERFRVRRDADEGVLVHRLARIQRADAVPFGINDLAVLDNAHRHSGHIKSLHRPLDQSVDLRLGESLRERRTR